MTPRKRRSRRKPTAAAKKNKARAAEVVAPAPEAPPVEDPRIETTLAPLMEALSENEALTSNLQDAEATRLLAWARVKAQKLVRQAVEIADDAEAKAFLETGTAELRKTMRSVNQQMEEAYEGDVSASERPETLLSEAAG